MSYRPVRPDHADSTHAVKASASPSRDFDGNSKCYEIKFVLSHALDIKAIHWGKTKNDRIDFYKIASLLRGENLPYAYPCQMRATRDLMRRRTFLVRKRAEGERVGAESAHTDR
jgi:hypothetical protein